MRTPRSVLVDTSAIFAMVSPVDRFHTQSMDIYSEFADRGYRLYTNSYVLVESSALIHKRLGFQPLQEFIQSIRDIWEILWVSQSVHEEIWNRMQERAGRGLSFVDWSVIVSAERTRSAIFTFDADFAQEGLRVIPVRSG